MPSETKGMSSETKGMSSETKGMSSEAKGSPSEIKGMPSEAKGMPSKVKGSPSEVKGMPSKVKGSPSESKGIPVQSPYILSVKKHIPAGTAGTSPYTFKEDSMTGDYIPTTESGLLPFAKTLYAFALANFARWSVPSPQTLLDALITAFETALTAYQSPNHGKVDTLAKNEAKAALVHALRTYIQGYIARNPAVTDEDKEEMGLPLRDTTPTPHPAPDTRPDVEAEPAGKGAHSVTAVNPHTHNKEKPELVTGVSFAHRVRQADEAVAAAELMPSEYQASSTKVYQYTEADYGKVADYAAAYENGTGKRGPWSNVVSLIISG
jgi:hypothetical protein